MLQSQSMLRLVNVGLVSWCHGMIGMLVTWLSLRMARIQAVSLSRARTWAPSSPAEGAATDDWGDAADSLGRPTPAMAATSGLGVC